MQRALWKFLGAMFIFSSNGIWVSMIALETAQIVLLRVFIGSLFLLTLFFLKKEKFTFWNYPKDGAYLLLSGVSMGASWLFLYESFRLLGVSMTILLHYTAPVIVLLLSPIFFGERLTWKKCLGVFVVMLGILCINGSAAGAGKSGFGFFCAILSALLYAAMVITNKKVERIAGFENTVLQMLSAFLIVAAYFIVRGEPFLFSIPKESLLYALILGIMNGGVANYLYFSSIGSLPVQTVAVFSYLDPLMSVILSAIVLGEAIGALQVVGAVCILGGAIFAELAGHTAQQGYRHAALEQEIEHGEKA